MSGCFIYNDNLDSQRMLHSLLLMGRYKAKCHTTRGCNANMDPLVLQVQWLAC